MSVTRFCRERLITLISSAASGFGRIVSASFSVPAGSIAARGAKPSAMTQAVSILTRMHKPDILRHLIALPAEDLGLDRVCAHFRAENLPVLKLACKAGFYIAAHGCEELASKQIAGSVLPFE